MREGTMNEVVDMLPSTGLEEPSLGQSHDLLNK